MEHAKGLQLRYKGRFISYSSKLIGQPASLPDFTVSVTETYPNPEKVGSFVFHRNSILPNKLTKFTRYTSDGNYVSFTITVQNISGEFSWLVW